MEKKKNKDHVQPCPCSSVVKGSSLLAWEASAIITESDSPAVKLVLALFVKNAHGVSSHKYGEHGAERIWNEWLTLTTGMSMVLPALYNMVFGGTPSSVAEWGWSLEEVPHSCAHLLGIWKQLSVGLPSENNQLVFICKNYTTHTRYCLGFFFSHLKRILVGKVLFQYQSM